MAGIQWSKSASLEGDFDRAMRRIYDLAGAQFGYWAGYFLRGVRNHGGLAYAKRLLAKPGTSDGFKVLQEHGRLDLTVEAYVLMPTFRELFTDEEIEIAQSRLDAARAANRKGSTA
jgi:hypothetical protein